MFYLAILAAAVTFGQEQAPSKQLQEQGFEIVETTPQRGKGKQQNARRYVASQNGKPREFKSAKIKHKGAPKFKRPKGIK